MEPSHCWIPLPCCFRGAHRWLVFRLCLAPSSSPLASAELTRMPTCLPGAQPLTTLRILDVHGIEEAPAQ